MPKRTCTAGTKVGRAPQTLFEAHGRLRADFVSLTIYGETIIVPLSQFYANNSYSFRLLEAVRKLAADMATARWHTDGLRRAFEEGLI